MTMKIFMFEFWIKPTPENPYFTRAKAGYATIWARAADLSQAEAIARAYVTSENWEIMSLVETGRETTLEGYNGQAEAQQRWLVAQDRGVSAEFALCSIDSAGGDSSSN